MIPDAPKTLSTRAAVLAAENARLRAALEGALAAMRVNLAVLAAAEQRCEPLRRAIGEAEQARKETTEVKI